MILVSGSYKDVDLYQNPLKLDALTAEVDLAMICKNQGIVPILERLDINGNTYSKYSINSHTSEPPSGSIQSVTLKQVLEDLLFTPKIVVAWPAIPTLALRGLTYDGTVTEVQYVESNQGAETLLPGSIGNPFPYMPLIVYDATDGTGTKVAKDGDIAENNNIDYLICNPAIFTLCHELTHAWHIIFYPAIQDLAVAEPFSQRLENTLRDGLGYRRRKIGGGTHRVGSLPGVAWKLCMKSDTVQQQDAPKSTQEQFHCFIATASRADLDELRAVRKSAAACSPLVARCLVSLFDDYYRFSPSIVREFDCNCLAAETACNSLIAFWKAIWTTETGPEVQRLAPDLTSAAEEWISTLGRTMPIGEFARWALLDATLVGIGVKDLSTWWASCPLARDHSADVDPEFDVHMERVGSPIRSHQIVVPHSSIPTVDDLRFSTTENDDNSDTIENSSPRNIFMSAADGDLNLATTASVVLLKPGGSVSMSRSVPHLLFSYQPPYDGINWLNGKWITALAIHKRQ